MHGNYPPATLGRLGTVPRLDDRPLQVRPAAQYRNLFGPPASGEAFHAYGFDRDQLPRTDHMLKGLAGRMSRPYRWPSTIAPGKQPDENPNLPSGYTYLGQFVAHDMSFVASTQAFVNEPLLEIRNYRAAALNLDTIYGGGPAERPYCYCPSAGSNIPRYLLRLGYFDDRNATAGGEQRRIARDLLRIACPSSNNPGTGLTDALVADPRNDDQPIVAQIAVLFCLLHNAICDYLLSKNIPIDGVFDVARNGVTLVYHNIIVQDYLHRLLNSDVYSRYTSEADPFIDRTDQPGMPVEFSHAAFRFGHAMIRASYQFNSDVNSSFGLRDVLRENCVSRAYGMPLPAIWIIQWSHFFDLGGQSMNLSRRIAPSMTPTLSDGSFEPTNVAGFALPYRDLVRGASLQMRSVASLVEKLPSSIKMRSRLLHDSDYRRTAIRNWLDEPAGFSPTDCEADHPLSEQDRNILADDPPLLFFLLFEAATTEDGQRLGILGSTIVAEVIFSILRTRPSSEPPTVANEALRSLLDDHMPESMPDLIRFLANRYDFTITGAPFV